MPRATALLARADSPWEAEPATRHADQEAAGQQADETDRECRPCRHLAPGKREGEEHVGGGEDANKPEGHENGARQRAYLPETQDLASQLLGERRLLVGDRDVAREGLEELQVAFGRSLAPSD